jgi:4-hydroxy-tetrahydrodipicolinate synthase
MADANRTIPAGIISACPTPMTEDLTVDHDVLAAHCRWLLANGCDGIAPLGSTGEANSFSVMERIEILEKLVMNGIPTESIIVGTGCCAFPDTVLLTKHALSLGVSATLVLPPYYYKNVGGDGLFESFDKIIQKVNDARLKILIYHNPGMSGISITRGLIERLIKTYPDTVVGMKDSGGDWDYMNENCKLFPGFRIYSGNEKYLLNILQAGGAGCISATLNVTSSLAAEVLVKWANGEAIQAQEKLSHIRSVFEQYPLISAVKCVLADISGKTHWLNVRPPITRLTKKDADELIRLLREESNG